MGCSSRNTEAESADRNWACADLTREVPEGNRDWLGNCTGGHLGDIIAKGLALFYPCPENPGEVELKMMDKFV